MTSKAWFNKITGQPPDLYQLQRFFERALRLRTACDLECLALRVTRPAELSPALNSLPGAGPIAELLPGLVKAVTKAGLFADPPVTRGVFEQSAKKDTKGKKT